MLRFASALHRVAALLGRDAGGHAVPDVDRDGEGGAERSVVRRNHGRQVQSPCVRRRQGRADDAAAVADDERHLFGGAKRGGDDHVALVLPVVVVRDDHDLAAGERLDGFRNGIAHIVPLSRCRRVEEEIIRRNRAAGFGDDALSGLARQPGAVVRGRSASPRRAETPMRRANSARETPMTPEPVGKLHIRKTVPPKMRCGAPPAVACVRGQIKTNAPHFNGAQITKEALSFPQSTRTSILPKFSPRRRSTSACGAFSRPCRIVSRHLSLPAATCPASSAIACGQRLM